MGCNGLDDWTQRKFWFYEVEFVFMKFKRFCVDLLNKVVVTFCKLKLFRNVVVVELVVRILIAWGKWCCCTQIVDLRFKFVGM